MQLSSLRSDSTKRLSTPVSSSTTSLALSNDNNNTVPVSYASEVDPIFTAWDKTTGIVITEAQIVPGIDFPVTLTGVETLTNKTITSPLGIVKADVGLDNVDNTSDANKPVSTATTTQLDLKEILTNKSTNVTTDGASDTKYPSVKAVKTYVDTHSGGVVSAHNDTTSKQGGIANEYYHLSSAQHTITTQAATAVRSGYLAGTDFANFAAGLIGAGVAIHSSLANLDYATAAHTGFAPSTSPSFTGDVAIGGNLILDNSFARTIINDLAGVFTLTNPADSGQILINTGTSANYVSKINIAARTAGTGIQFFTRSTERMRVSDDGNIGIGTTAPATGNLLEVNGRISFTSEDGVLKTLWAGGYGGVLQLQKHGGTDDRFARIGIVDATNAWMYGLTIFDNGNVEIGGFTTPLSKVCINGGLHVGGESAAGDNNLLVDGTITISDTTNSAITNYGGVLKDNYVSQTTGYRISATGSADFRYLYADEMHVKSFITDLEQALAGGQIISKSVAKVAIAFTIPAAGANETLVVEEFAGYTGAVFVNGDMIRLRQFTRANNTTLNVADVWGTVVYVSRDATANPTTQTYTFTRSSAPNAGTGSGTINVGSLALDYGTTGNGYYEVTAVDGLNGVNSPYAQFVTWTTHPVTTLTCKTRIGNLIGITDADLGGALSGYGLYADNVYLKGKIVATSGLIAGWSLDADSLYVGTKYNPSSESEYTSDGITIGSDGTIRSVNFSIDPSGVIAIKTPQPHWMTKVGSTNLRHSHDSEIISYGPNLNYIQVKGMTFPNSLNGEQRISFEIKINDSKYSANAKLCKDGVLIGVEQTTSSDSYTTIPQYIIENWDGGEELQLWVKSPDPGCDISIRNFRVSYDDGNAIIVAVASENSFPK